MKAVKKLAAIVCALLFAAALGGCKGDTGGGYFRYDIPGPVDNLDPQFATDSTARMILGNLYEGLVTQSGSGEIRPGVASSHEVSADGLRYTFHLRRDAVWSDGSPVTAEDFAFSFRRIFGSGSPYAARFAAIRGSDSGTLAGFGVEAEDAYTLVFTLTRPDPFLLEKLCDPCAAPCNEAFFSETRGRYGLELASVCSNGPFYLDRWDNSQSLRLLMSESYVSEAPTAAEGVTFYIGRKDSASAFLEGDTDLCLLDYRQQDDLRPRQATLQPLNKTVWCLVFNQGHGLWGNPLLRQGLAHTVDHELMGEGLPLGFTATSVLVPEAIRLGDRSFRELAPAESPLTYDTQEGERLFRMGLAALGREQLPSAALFNFPELAAQSLNMATLQQGWQKYLLAYLNFEVAAPEQIQSKFRTRDYQILLMPFTPATSDIDSFFGAFLSDSSQNYFGYHNPLYDDLLRSAAAQPTRELAAEKYAQAERMLLSDAVVVPLFAETSYLAVSAGVEGIETSPAGDLIYFKYATRAS